MGLRALRDVSLKQAREYATQLWMRISLKLAIKFARNAFLFVRNNLFFSAIL